MPGEALDVGRNATPVTTRNGDKLDPGTEFVQERAAVLGGKVGDRRLDLVGEIMPVQTVIDSIELALPAREFHRELRQVGIHIQIRGMPEELTPYGAAEIRRVPLE
jgi:hypothetical protein